MRAIALLEEGGTCSAESTRSPRFWHHRARYAFIHQRSVGDPDLFPGQQQRRCKTQDELAVVHLWSDVLSIRHRSLAFRFAVVAASIVVVAGDQPMLYQNIRTQIWPDRITLQSKLRSIILPLVYASAVAFLLECRQCCCVQRGQTTPISPVPHHTVLDPVQERTKHATLAAIHIDCTARPLHQFLA